MTQPTDPRQLWLDFALFYAGQGLPVFPVHGVIDGRCTCGNPACRNPGKHPKTPNGLLDATTDRAKLEQWALAGYSNIAIAIPDGYAVIDVDPRNDGVATMQRLVSAHGELPDTLAAATGSDPPGGHVWLRIPPGMKLPGKLGPGVDIKQHGGYVVVPPSRHASGRHYGWIDPSKTIADAPQWILAQARSRAASSAVDTTAVQETPPVLEASVHDAMAAALTPHVIRGQMHDLAKYASGWMKQRGASLGDVAEVFRRLPFVSHDGAIKAARWAYGSLQPFGFEDLCKLIGRSAVDRLDETVPHQYRQALTANSPMLQPAQPAQPAPQLESAPDPFAILGERIDLSAPIEEPIYAVEHLPWHFGSVGALVGYPGEGKSPTAAALAVSLANGTDWLGHRTRKGKVLCLCFESPIAFARIVRRVAAASGLSIDDIEVRKAEPGDLEAVAFRKAIKDGPWNHVLIDTYNSGVLAGGYNDSEYATPMKLLSSDVQPHQCIVVVLHTNKSAERPSLKSITGTGALGGAIKAAVGVWRPSDAEDEYTFELTCVRAPDKRFKDERFRVTDVEKDGNPKWGLALELVTGGMADAVNPEPAKETADQKRSRMLALASEFVDLQGDGAEITIAALRAHCKAAKADAADRRALDWAVRQLVTDGVLVPERGRKGVWRSPSAYERAMAAGVAPPDVAPPVGGVAPPSHWAAVLGPQIAAAGQLRASEAWQLLGIVEPTRGQAMALSAALESLGYASRRTKTTTPYGIVDDRVFFPK